MSVAANFRNDGRSAITDAKLSLSGPCRLDGRGRPAHCRSLPTDHQLGGTWQVTVPAAPSPGTYTAHRECQLPMGRRHAHGGASSGQGGFQVLVAPTGYAEPE